MKTKLLLICLLIGQLLIYAQLAPSKGDYYSVDATTQSVVFTDENSLDKHFLPVGTIIKIRSVENDKIYFQVLVNNKEIKKGELYYIYRVEFTEKYFSPRFYVRSGLLTVPFKYRPDKSKVYPGGNIAAAGSFTYNILGIGLQPLLFAGISAISVTDLNTVKATTETKWGFTTGIGINFEVFESVNLGLVTGWDMIDTNWESNGRIWLALSFNYRFLE